MKITITIDTCAENFDDLRKFLDAMESVPIAPGDETPAGAPSFEVVSPKTPEAFPEPQAEAKPQAKTKPVDEQPKITAQDVKAVCLKLSKAGKQAELKAAFAKFGGKKLSDIAESDFGALLEELGDA